MEGERRPAVLTPHPGEFARLRAGSGETPDEDGDLVDDDEARLSATVRAAETWGSVVVLKGARTIVAAPDGTAAIAPFENPALATGGTGDVLAGAIGSFLAQGVAPFAAARLGVYLHGVAGEAGRERFGDAGLIASDLPDGLAIARKRLLLDRTTRSGAGSVHARESRRVRPARRRPEEPAVGEPLPRRLPSASRCRTSSRRRSQRPSRHRPRSPADAARRLRRPMPRSRRSRARRG